MNEPLRRLAAAVLVTCGASLPGLSAAEIVLQADDGTRSCKAEALLHAASLSAARESRFSEALAILGELRVRCPATRPFLFDNVAVSSWAGQHATAWTEGRHLIVEKDTPAYVMEALGVSARESRHFEDARAAYDVLLDRNPGHLDAQIGRALTLLRAGKLDLARRALLELTERAPERADVLDSLSRTYGEGNWTGVLAAAQAVLERAPQSRAAQRMRFQALRELGAPRLALSLTPAKILTPDELVEARRERLAATVRAARVEADTQAGPGRWAATDAAINELAGAAAALADDGNTAAVRAQQFDLLVALVDRGQSRDAIALFEKLSSSAPPPPFVRLAAAAAYLAQRRPAIAVTLYEGSLDSDPRNLNARFGYFYALLESGRPREAVKLMEHLGQVTPEWRDPDLPDLRRANPDYPLVQARLGLALAYTNALDAAQRHLDDLALRAPANLDIRNSRNIVYQLRGWPRIAEADYNWLLSGQPDYQWGAIGMFDSAMAVRDFALAERWLGRASLDLPDEDATRKRQSEWALRARPELRFEMGMGRGYGGSAVSDPSTARDRVMDVLLYSPPLGHNWRVFGHLNRSSRQSSGESQQRTASGAGIEYSRRDWLASVEARTLSQGRSAGLAGRVVHELGDHFTIAGEAETASLAVPVRAHAQGIDARRALVDITYRLHESSSAGFGMSQMQFTDDNRRRAWFGAATQRLVSGPVYRLDARLDAYASSNSLTAPTVYFNPGKDRSVLFGLHNEWLQFRVYERALRHRIVASMGSYWQQGFRRDALRALRYELAYEHNEQLTLNGGVGMTWRPFDGVSERLATVYFSGNWRF